jgi:hypothetical protein
MSHFATFLSSFCDTFSPKLGLKNQNIVANLLNVDKDKKLCQKSTHVFNLSEMHTKSCNKMLVSLSVT